MAWSFDLSGKSVIVTGGNVGLGKAMARRFLELGAKVATCSRRDYDSPPAAEGLEGTKGRIFHSSIDVREVDQLDAFVENVMDAYGRIDVLVNNAGGSPGHDSATASHNFIAKIVALNFSALLDLSQRANVVMQKQDEGGAIINISSMAGLGASPGLTVYGAAKAAVINLTSSLAVEWGPKVRVNCIAPGFVLTEGADFLLPTEQAKEAAAQMSPLKKLCTPEEIADVAVFLASEASRYVNGVTIPVDGGGRVMRG
jgi:NAD(P)-dependent dehydrogenase (short-subunit alcohol dehydrogenase family)